MASVLAGILELCPLWLQDSRPRTRSCQHVVIRGKLFPVQAYHLPFPLGRWGGQGCGVGDPHCPVGSCSHTTSGCGFLLSVHIAALRCCVPQRHMTVADRIWFQHCPACCMILLPEGSEFSILSQAEGGPCLALAIPCVPHRRKTGTQLGPA